ncbi:MAG: 1-acyl-sn-glycerol-3-phosphate acyltransferase [Candidatus Neomarinimicrobiota bacterium]|nr:MAG: 1-acyl-sn-glycerol-3-phosphate acyltransferase [Candidatus Neomarinimicrobiota bacterium]
MRLIWVLLNLGVWTVLLSLVGMVVSLFEWRGRFFGWIARLWSRIILRAAGVRYTVRGLDQLNRQGHYVFACNHESAFDIPLAFAGLPYQLAPISKIELRKIPFFGWAMILARHVFIDRRNHEQAVAALQRAKESLERNPRSVLVFPEGTRSLDGKVHEFKRGGIVLALEAGLPLVPVAVCGTSQVAQKGRWELHPARVELRVGAPIDTTRLTYGDRKRVAESLRQQVVDMKTAWERQRAA